MVKCVLYVDMSCERLPQCVYVVLLSVVHNIMGKISY